MAKIAVQLLVFGDLPDGERKSRMHDAYDKCLAGLDQFKMEDDRNGCHTMGFQNRVTIKNL